MAIEKSEAVILRVVDFSNTSCVVTAYTRDFGKISGLAKGARRLKSPFESALDVLAICHLVFVHKTSDALDLLTEAKLERRFRAAATDLERLYAGYYLVELTMALTDHADPQPELYDLLISAIVGLDSGERPGGWITRFELRMLALTGHGVSLEHCTSCGRPIGSTPHYAFGIAASGLICQRCRPGKKQVISIDAATRAALQIYSAAGDQWRHDARWSDVGGPLRGLMNQLITYVLGHRPKLLPYLGTAKP